MFVPWRLQSALGGGAVILIAALPFLYWNAFAGDAQVHLVFMETAAAGRFFEFNPGERVSGETSPGYMLLGACLFRTLPAASVPVALKVIGLIAWYLLGWLVYHVAAQFLGHDGRAGFWPILAALISAAIPGSVYNANVGMENGVFAALIWAWVALALRWRWLDREGPGWGKEILLASILGLAGWIRPEALPFSIVAYTFAILSRRTAPVLLFGLGVAVAISLLAFAFQYAHTGDVIPTSILSRRIVAMSGSWRVGPFLLDPTFGLRLLLYLPITLLFFWYLRAGADTTSPLERLLQTALGAFFVIFTLFGAPHLGRYVIFLMPILTVGAAGALRSLWERRRPKLLVGGAALALLGVIAGELHERGSRFHAAQLSIAINAPSSRRTATDRLITVLGKPAHRPVVVALEAVQLRYVVDNRILVRSLDGRVDRSLLGFAQGDSLDHLAYLHHQRVDYLLDTPTYGRISSAGSLEPLRRVPPGHVLTSGGLRFRRLHTHRKGYAVEKSAE